VQCWIHDFVEFSLLWLIVSSSNIIYI
jgi:hypothetical protein